MESINPTKRFILGYFLQIFMKIACTSILLQYVPELIAFVQGNMLTQKHNLAKKAVHFLHQNYISNIVCKMVYSVKLDNDVK